MKKLNYYLATSTVALALIAAAPLFASADEGSNASVKADANVGLHLGSLFHFGTEQGKSGDHKNIASTTKSDGDNDNDNDGGKDHATSTPVNGTTIVAGTVTAVNGSIITVTSKNNTTYTVDATNATVSTKDAASVTVGNVHIGDVLVVRGTLSGSTIVATKVLDSALMARNFLSALGVAGGGVVTSVNGSTFTVKPFGAHATTTVTTDASTIYKLNGQAASSTALTAGAHVLVTGTTTSPTGITASIVSIFTAGFGFFKHLFFH